MRRISGASLSLRVRLAKMLTTLGATFFTTGAKLVVIPDCGHLPQLEKPEAMTAALRDWLAM